MDITVSPNPKPVSFGIYKGTKITGYGYKDYGVYRDKNIEIYHATRDNMKLQYVSDSICRFIKSKLIYFQDGVRKITRSYGNGMQR